MNHQEKPMSCLIAAILPLLGAAFASDVAARSPAIPNMVADMAAMPDARLKLSSARFIRDVAQIAPLPPVVSTLASPVDFRTTSGLDKRRSYTVQWEGFTFSANATRTKSPRQEITTAPFSYNRFSVIKADAVAAKSLGAHDRLTLGTNLIVERRRPSYFLGGHNLYRTVEHAVSLEWDHDDHIRLTGTRFAIAPAGSRSTVDRQVELASGSQLAKSGHALTMSVSPKAGFEALSFGVDLCRERYSAMDAALVAASPERSHMRVTLFLRRLF
jgi:hypothetical protein